jgi:hypothetical protein
MSGYPDNNPKTAIGASKVPLHLVPPSAKYYLALALRDGAIKYGPYNWRDAEISVSVYRSAAERHLDAFWDGEDCAPDSGIHHIAHAMACMALILDAMSIGKLHDDRPTKGAAPLLQVLFADQTKPKTIEIAEGVLAHVEDAPMPPFATFDSDEGMGLKAGEANVPVESLGREA